MVKFTIFIIAVSYYGSYANANPQYGYNQRDAAGLDYRTNYYRRPSYDIGSIFRSSSESRQPQGSFQPLELFSFPPLPPLPPLPPMPKMSMPFMPPLGSALGDAESPDDNAPAQGAAPLLASAAPSLLGSAAPLKDTMTPKPPLLGLGAAPAAGVTQVVSTMSSDGGKPVTKGLLLSSVNGKVKGTAWEDTPDGDPKVESF